MSILQYLGASNFFSISKPLVKKIGLQTACILQEIISKYEWHGNNTKDFEESYGLYYSQNDMAEDFGISIKTVQRELQKLKELGLIEINHKGTPARNYYKLNIKNIMLFLGDNKTSQKVATGQVKKSQLDKSKSRIITIEEKELEKEKNIHNFSKKIISQFPDIENFISSNFKNPDVIKKYVNFINNRAKKHPRANLSLEICQEHILELKKCKDVTEAIVFLQKAFDCGWQGLNLEWIKPKTTTQNTQKSIYITN